MNDNPYQSPKSVTSNPNDEAIKPIFSPGQIAFGSFWGGPFAAVYFLRANYLSLGRYAHAQKMTIVGLLISALIIALIPFLPEKFPNVVLPVLYSVAATQLARLTQLCKEDIEYSECYSFASNWVLFGIATLCLVMFLVIAIAVMFGLELMGVVSLS